MDRKTLISFTLATKTSWKAFQWPIEGTAKHENKASYNTDYIVPDFTDFFGDDWKEIKTQIEKKKHS